MNKEESYLHWYLFVLTERASSGVAISNTTVGYPDQKISQGRIKAVKKEAGFTEKASVLSINYLGEMKESELDEGT